MSCIIKKRFQLSLLYLPNEGNNVASLVTEIYICHKLILPNSNATPRSSQFHPKRGTSRWCLQHSQIKQRTPSLPLPFPKCNTFILSNEMSSVNPLFLLLNRFYLVSPQVKADQEEHEEKNKKPRWAVAKIRAACQIVMVMANELITENNSRGNYRKHLNLQGILW